MDQLFPPDKKCEQVNNEPFGPNNLPPAARKILQDLTLDSLRSLANDHVNHAYTNYLAACLEVKGKVQKKKDEREAKEKATIELALGAVGMCLGPVATAVGAKIAGPAIQSFVKSQIEEKLPGKLTALLAADAKLATAMAGDAYKIVASDAVTSLAARFTPEAASGLLGSAGAAAGKAMFKVDLNGGPEDRTIAYVDALMEQTDQTHKALLTAIGTSTNEDALMGAYSKFSSVTLKQYRAEIEQTANHFLTQIAPTAGPGHKQQIVSVNAYGRARLASAIFSNPGDALFGEIKPWIFKSWVTPDMEKTARSMNSNIQTVKPTAFSNHIPDPGIEGEISGEEHIVQMDAWGKMRLAIIKSDVSIWSGPSGKVVFVRWVQADDEETTRIKGSTQVAGIPTIDPSRCEGGIAKPADA